MEMEIRRESKAMAKRKHTILDRVTFLDNGIKIPNLNLFMWTQKK